MLHYLGLKLAQTRALSSVLTLFMQYIIESIQLMSLFKSPALVFCYSPIVVSNSTARLMFILTKQAPSLVTVTYDISAVVSVIPDICDYFQCPFIFHSPRK